jgi:hypothetical protein
MYKVFIIDDSAPDHRRLVGSTGDPQVVAAAAGGMLAVLPEFRGRSSVGWFQSDGRSCPPLRHRTAKQ